MSESKSRLERLTKFFWTWLASVFFYALLFQDVSLRPLGTLAGLLAIFFVVFED